MPQYEFDKSSFSFKKTGHTIWSVLLTVLRFVAVTLLLAVVYYLVFALVISTDTERKLRRENRMYERIYPQMLEREQMLDKVITGLQVKDNEIYQEIFSAQAPSLNSEDAFDILAGSDTIPDRKLVEYTSGKADDLLEKSKKVEESFAGLLDDGSKILPPLSLPLKSVSYAQVGASIGQRMNPFYKVPSRHDGLDLIAPQGDPVLAAADGIVSDVNISRKGLGNQVEIRHDGGYVTRYAHLGDVEVRVGQVVKTGRKLGTVGISGNSFAPHLHYEVLKDGEYLDPVNYFFASVTPDEYVKMLFMSVTTGQSLD